MSQRRGYGEARADRTGNAASASAVNTLFSTAHSPRYSGSSPVSLSGLFNRYGTIPFAFPADVELEGLGTLSDTPICCRGHDRYAIVTEKRLLLTGAEAEVDAYLKQWR